ncbi:MAG: helix-turn-helix domain-containing protein [Candidatus Neptunochlamydia sp.]|nr:helix-turn-helix domain-containing protein [Candidatus Neptunochlamydia sp.]
MKNKIDKALTVTEAAKIKGVNRSAVLIAINRGKLKTTFFRGEWHIRESSLREYDGFEEDGDSIRLDEAVRRTQISCVLIRKVLPAVRAKGKKLKIRIPDLDRWMKDALDAKKYKQTSYL